MARKSRIHFVYDIPIRKIVSEAGLVLKIPTEFINSEDRNRLGAFGRGVVGLIGRKLGSHTIRAMAGHFNRVPVAITQGVKKVEAKLREESDFKKAIEKIEKKLIKKREKKYLITYAPIYSLVSL